MYICKLIHSVFIYIFKQHPNFSGIRLCKYPDDRVRCAGYDVVRDTS